MVDKTRKMHPIKNTKIPDGFCFVDTETTNELDPIDRKSRLLKFRLGVMATERYDRHRKLPLTYRYLKDTKDFWLNLKKFAFGNRETWVWAHNLGFDLTILGMSKLIREGRFTVKGKASKNNTKGKYGGFFCCEDPPTIIKCWDDEGNLYYFVDSVNFWKASLEKLGEESGENKFDMPGFDEVDNEWFEYCKQDVRVLRGLVVNLCDWLVDNDLGPLRFTAPSQAMTIYKKRFLTKPLLIHQDPDLRDLERHSYMGGRLELKQYGLRAGKWYQLDVCSLYPYIMKTHLFPRKVLETSKGIKTKLDPENIRDSSFLASVIINDEHNQYPKKVKEGTIWCTGNYATVLCGNELRKAVKRRSVQHVCQWVKYDICDLFSEFVDYLFELRHSYEKEGLNFQALLCKLFLNSFYGKFGQMTPAWEEWDGEIDCESFAQCWDDPDNTGEPHCFRRIGDLVEHKAGKREHPQAIPSVASFVTSYAREYMRELIDIAGEDNVSYIVTDALYCNQTGFDNLNKKGMVGNRELGKLDVEHQSNGATFNSIHHYRMGKKFKAGSIKAKDATSVGLNLTEFHFEGMRSMVKHGWGDTVRIVPREKHYKEEYRRGYLDGFGGVKPLRLTMRELDGQLLFKGGKYFYPDNLEEFDLKR